MLMKLQYNLKQIRKRTEPQAPTLVARQETPPAPTEPPGWRYYNFWEGTVSEENINRVKSLANTGLGRFKPDDKCGAYPLEGGPLSFGNITDPFIRMDGLGVRILNGATAHSPRREMPCNDALKKVIDLADALAKGLELMNYGHGRDRDVANLTGIPATKILRGDILWPGCRVYGLTYHSDDPNWAIMLTNEVVIADIVPSEQAQGQAEGQLLPPIMLPREG
ncbi:hypothetical protein ABW19_dt0205308 [Dactylella cylindrospora]|nr:hypothetical protein ABW19_dt0205308 [Dactylella cylindrospora]